MSARVFLQKHLKGTPDKVKKNVNLLTVCQHPALFLQPTKIFFHYHKTGNRV